MSGLLASLVLIGVLIGVMGVLLLLSWFTLYCVSRLEDGSGPEVSPVGPGRRSRRRS
jgi:hypothetical protein